MYALCESFFAMILYKIQIMQAILIFSIYRQRNRWKLDSSVGTIKNILNSPKQILFLNVVWIFFDLS